MLAQIVLILALLLVLVGMIMVLLDAFSENFFWGLLVLIIPLLVPVYCFIKWNHDQARNGFAMSLVGIVMAAAGIYGGGIHAIPGLADHEVVKNLPSALPPAEPLPNEEAAAKVVIEDEEEYDPILSTNKDKFSSKEIEPLAPKEDKTVKTISRAKIRKVAIDKTDINSSIGKNVEVVFMDSTSKRGRLIASAEDSISVEEQISGGIVSFEYKLEKIKSILLLIDPSAPPPPPVVKKQDSPVEVKKDLVRPAPKSDSKDDVTAENKSSLPSTTTVDSETAVTSAPQQNKSLVSPPIQ